MSSINLPTSRDMISLLGEDFFKEEVRCDYLVSEKMKKIWAVNIDLYLEFTRICEEYQSKHYAYAGTVLGAIRHHGFIPWDDDMDVCMPRKDYEKFLELASSELSSPYFLQTPFTEQGYFRTITRLSNIKTTRLLNYYKHSGMSHGMMLDIFPLDECNPNTNEQEIQEILLSAKRCSQYMKRNDTNIMTPEHFASWKKYMTNEPLKEWEHLQNIAKRWSNCHSDFYAMKVLVVGGKYNLPLRKDWFNSTKKVAFEKIEIQIPSNYASFLTTIYGEYMKFPPLEQRGMWHSGVLIDPEKPYTEYMDN